MRSIVLTLALTVALALTGCISNVDDLKDRLGSDAPADEPVEPAATQTPAANATETAPKVTKAPVARIAIFGANGALIFKSTFKADDPAEMIFVEEKTSLNLIASDSEALEPGATIAGFEWSIDGKPIGADRQLAYEASPAGRRTLTLSVTDSQGAKDTQSLVLGVLAEPVLSTAEFTTDPMLGAEGVGTPSETNISTDVDPSGYELLWIEVTALPPISCDVAIEIVDADGVTVSDANERDLTENDMTTTPPSSGQIEVATLKRPAPGDYVVRLVPIECVEPEGFPLKVTIASRPLLEGPPTGDGHGDAH